MSSSTWVRPHPYKVCSSLEYNVIRCYWSISGWEKTNCSTFKTRRNKRKLRRKNSVSDTKEKKHTGPGMWSLRWTMSSCDDARLLFHLVCVLKRKMMSSVVTVWVIQSFVAMCLKMILSGRAVSLACITGWRLPAGLTVMNLLQSFTVSVKSKQKMFFNQNVQCWTESFCFRSFWKKHF